MTDPMYKFQTPIKVGNVMLSNRVVLLSAARRLNTKDWFMSEANIAYYTNYAKNGVGLIITEACKVDPSYPAHNLCMISVQSDEYIPGMKKLVDSVHQYDSKLLFQLWSPGGLLYNITPEQCVTVNDYTIDEVHTLQQRYVDAAIRCKKSGADGVELHMAHNYQMEQFLLPYYNKRTDEYGAQTVESGTRFTIEIARKIREAVDDPDFLIAAKINGYDCDEDRLGAMTPEICVEACKLLEKAGVQLITVNAGGTDSDVTNMSDNGRRPEGWKVCYAEKVKAAVSIPVIASGSLRHPTYMDQIITEGKCDMVGMARGLMAEPELLTKINKNCEDELKQCISCLNCLYGDYSFCSINPACGREWNIKPLVNNGNGRAVAVVGAGPAGLEAAVDLAKRGFKPIIFERDSVIGGVERLAAVPNGKAKLMWHIDYFERMIKKLDIEVRLNTLATADTIRDLNPYAVIIAAGTDSLYPSTLPGIEGENVIDGRAYLRKMPNISGKKVVVIGGGTVGLEIALELKEHGNEVDVLEMLPPATDRYTRFLIVPSVMKGGVVIYNEHRVEAIKADGVVAVDLKSNRLVEFSADKIVIAMGGRTNNGLYNELRGEYKRIYCIGDAVKLRKIVCAVHEAYETVADLE